jgi:hypothetical protein
VADTGTDAATGGGNDSVFTLQNGTIDANDAALVPDPKPDGEQRRP